MLINTRLPSKQDYRARYPDARPFSRYEHRCRSGLHRPSCGGSTPPSCRVRVASIAAMQRSLKPQSTGQHRGDPPAFALRASARQANRLHGAALARRSAKRAGGSRSSNYQSATLRTSRLQVRVLPGVPIQAALAQLPEALRSGRRGWGWNSLTRHHFVSLP